MKRIFNYTGRKKIERKRFSFNFIRQNRTIVSFSLDKLQLDGLNLPPGAKIYVEAYYRTELKRFDSGMAGNIVHPRSTDLTDMAYPENLKFRILVVDPLDGKILTCVDGVTPEEPTERKSLLPVEFKDLGNEIWRLEYEGDEGAPILCINSKIPNIQNMAKQEVQFLTHVYSAVVREILTYMVFVDGVDSVTDSSVDWHADWLKFSRILHLEPPEILNHDDNNFDKDEAVKWIDDVVTAFSNTHASKFQEYVHKLGETP